MEGVEGGQGGCVGEVCKSLSRGLFWLSQICLIPCWRVIFSPLGGILVKIGEVGKSLSR